MTTAGILEHISNLDIAKLKINRGFTIGEAGTRLASPPLGVAADDLNLEQALDEGPRDLESVLRLACIAVSEAKISWLERCYCRPPRNKPKRSRRAERLAQ